MPCQRTLRTAEAFHLSFPGRGLVVQSPSEMSLDVMTAQAPETRALCMGREGANPIMLEEQTDHDPTTQA